MAGTQSRRAENMYCEEGGKWVWQARVACNDITILAFCSGLQTCTVRRVESGCGKWEWLAMILAFCSGYCEEGGKWVWKVGVESGCGKLTLTGPRGVEGVHCTVQIHP